MPLHRIGGENRYFFRSFFFSFCQMGPSANNNTVSVGALWPGSWVTWLWRGKRLVAAVLSPKLQVSSRTQLKYIIKKRFGDRLFECTWHVAECGFWHREEQYNHLQIDFGFGPSDKGLMLAGVRNSFWTYPCRRYVCGKTLCCDSPSTLAVPTAIMNVIAGHETCRRTQTSRKESYANGCKYAAIRTEGCMQSKPHLMHVANRLLWIHRNVITGEGTNYYLLS